LAAEGAPSFVWVPEIPAAGASVELSPDESRYLARVCRVRAGERVNATDGRGGIAELQIRTVGRTVSAEVVSGERRERPRTAFLACGAPEGERGDWLVEKLAEFGVAVWQPVDFDRARWRPALARRERWQRLARAALRQSQQAWEMEVRVPIPLEELVTASSGPGGRWFADPEGVRWSGSADPTWIVVGPAGGLSAGEKERLSAAHFLPMSLGPNRLRTETAALCAAALWRAG